MECCDFQAVPERGVHRGGDLVLGERHVAHDDRLRAAPREGRPGREALKGLHLQAIDGTARSVRGTLTFATLFFTSGWSPVSFAMVSVSGPTANDARAKSTSIGRRRPSVACGPPLGLGDDPTREAAAWPSATFPVSNCRALEGAS